MSSPDLVGLAESAYDIDAQEREWLHALASRLTVPFAGSGVAAYCVTLGGTLEPRSYVEVGEVPSFHRAVVAEGHPGIPNPFELDRMYRSIGTSLASELLGGVPDNWEFVQAMFRRGGFEDCAALLAYDGTAETATFTAYVPSAVVLTPRMRTLWRRIATHVSSGLRLRRRLATVARSDRLDCGEAVLEADGRLAHADAAAASHSAREALRAAVRAADRARAGLRRSDPERALGLWQGLVQGRWSLVDHFDSDGRRFVVAFRNDPDPPGWRKLGVGERQVVEYASLGLSNKEIGYVLGLAPSTVSTHLLHALGKLGCLRRTELCRLAGDLSARSARRSVVLDGDVRVDAVSRQLEQCEWMMPLTTAEREVALDVIAGMSNAEIARKRGRAVRTVANQLAAVFAKTRARSRVGLAALHAGRAPADDEG